jgi:hypothetical protein
MKSLRGLRSCPRGPKTTGGGAGLQIEAFYHRLAQLGDSFCPNGRRPRVRMVRQMDEGAVAARLITAYPLEA